MRPDNKSLLQDLTYTERRKMEARDYLRGMTQVELAEKYGVSQPTISNDLKAIREQWIESALVSFHEVKARELARIDELEREYWDAWRRSREERQKTKTKRKTLVGKDKVGNTVASSVVEEEATVQREQRDGAAQFLSGIQWCIEQRCKIFGLYEPEKFAIVDWRKEAQQRGIDVTAEYERLVGQFAAAIEAGSGEDAG